MELSYSREKKIIAGKTDSELTALNTSVTSQMRQYFEAETEARAYTVSTVEASVDSIYKLAMQEGLTVEDWVHRDPIYATKIAEANYAQWLSIQTIAATTGVLQVDDYDIEVTKDVVKALDSRVARAKECVDLVKTIAFHMPLPGERRRDQLVRVAYKKAVEKGDAKLLTYLIDRVDGRPHEAQQAALDHDNAFNVYQIIHTLFKDQLEVLNSGPGTKLICCSRRAGKTYLLCAAALIECLRMPNTVCIYVGQTQTLMEGIVNTTMNEIINKGNLKDAKGMRLNWKKLDNGSHILIRGLSTTHDPDSILGHKAKIIIIDEFFHLKDELLEYLIREVLRPMQMDYAADYKFLCAGTPPTTKVSYGAMAWRTWDTPRFTWTWKDNPYPVDPELKLQYIENEIREIGQTWESPYVRRMYLAEWVYDDDLLLYPTFHTYNPRELIPSFHIDKILFGIDYGVGDSDCIIGIAWDSQGRRGYEFYEEKFNRLSIREKDMSQLQYLEVCVRQAWELALDLLSHYEPKDANKRILWDADDNQQHITDHFNLNIRLAKYPDLRLNIQNAHKADKVMMFDKIRDLLHTANLLLIEGGKCAKECEQTILKQGPGGQVFPEVDDKTYHPDLLPALRYALFNTIGIEALAKKASNPEEKIL